MTARAALLGAGSSLRYDGHEWRVSKMDGGSVLLAGTGATAGRWCRIDTLDLIHDPSFRVADRDCPEEARSVLSDLPADKLAGANDRRGLVLQAIHDTPEPFLATDADPPGPGVSGQTRRVRRLAKEHKIAERTLRNWIKRYEEHGLYGLVDRRGQVARTAVMRNDARVVKATREILDEAEERSTVTQKELYRRVGQRLAARHDPGPQMPGRTMFAALLKELRGVAHDGLSAASKRSANSRPTPIVRAGVTRAGQRVGIDSTPLNLFVIDEDGGEPYRPHLLIAVDDYTSMICNLAVVRGELTGLDITTLLYGIFDGLPAVAGGGPETTTPAFGVPESLLIDADRVNAGEGVGPGRLTMPATAPENLIVDHAKINFASPCRWPATAWEPT